MKFSIYKRGQGYYTRLCSAFAGAGIAALGCYQLMVTLNNSLSGDMSDLARTSIAVVVPFVILIVLGLFIFQIVNKPKSADFMIETEGEMKKVNWPAKKEVISSTKVVIVTFIGMALIIGAIDILFRMFFRLIGIITTQG